ncbi:MAG: hypothetical protein M0026_07000 [Nocardiopsaceae bacterium]|nr:hypothetical protein [Nocardiopsaceae bacterium]
MTSYPQGDRPHNRGPQIDGGTERSLESTEADYAEQHSTAAEADGDRTKHEPLDAGGTERSLESTEADYAEQHSEVTGTGGDWMRRMRLDVDDEVSEADAVEQLQEVELDEEEYR